MLYIYMYEVVNALMLLYSPVTQWCRAFPSMCICLVLVVAGEAHILVLAREYYGLAVDSSESLGCDGRAVCADRGTNGHEKARSNCQSKDG